MCAGTQITDAQALPAQWVPYAHAGVRGAVDLGLRAMLAPAKLTLATLTAASRPAISGVLSGIWRAQWCRFNACIAIMLGPVCVPSADSLLLS